jgi:hypothetical protein
MKADDYEIRIDELDTLDRWLFRAAAVAMALMGAGGLIAAVSK